MVNFGFNTASLLGLIQIFMALALFAISVINITQLTESSLKSNLRSFSIITQLFIIPFMLFFSGIILIWHGWRLDPLLQLQQFLNFLIINFFITINFINIINNISEGKSKDSSKPSGNRKNN